MYLVSENVFIKNVFIQRISHVLQKTCYFVVLSQCLFHHPEGFGTCNRLGHGLQLFHRFGDFQRLGQVTNMISSLNPKQPILNGWKWLKETHVWCDLASSMWIETFKYGCLDFQVLICLFGKYLRTFILDCLAFCTYYNYTVLSLPIKNFLHVTLPWSLTAGSP